ncbi:MAG: FAD-binding oxidoreductase, partial [Oscillospiraceae bacterium]|nr:FAD-binding oxidoreductase [Oscillospiraceae bacterium]
SDLSAARLRDESRMTGSCETFSVPTAVEELQSIARSMLEQAIPITMQGAMTGICGCAVPSGGHVISTERLNKIIGHRKDGERYFVTLECGVTLSELLTYCTQHFTKLCGYTFMPNPSEKLASFGGMFSCNAKGINSQLHGDVVGAVSSLTALFPNGAVAQIKRGEYVFDEHGCNVPELGRLEIDNLPEIGCNAKGLAFAHSGSDLIDVLGGSEGMLAVVTQFELELKKPAQELWGTLFFFENKQAAFGFSDKSISLFDNQSTNSVSLAAVEYLDSASMTLVNEYKKQLTQLSSLPDFPSSANSAIYIELEGSSADETEAQLAALLELFSSCGGDETDTWAASGSEEISKFRALRHAVPEALNYEIDKARQTDSRIAKLATDLETPSLPINEAEKLYSALLSENGLTGAVFGHLHANRLHMNITPKNYAEYEKGKKLISDMLLSLVAEDSCVTWENGIGKTKKGFLCLLTEERLSTAKAIKQFFDKKSLLNPNNML